MACGVDWIHLLEVGVGMKKPRGVIGSGNMHICYYLGHSEGSRTRAQRLCEVKRENKKLHIRVGR